jgi:hypothetical protein
MAAHFLRERWRGNRKLAHLIVGESSDSSPKPLVRTQMRRLDPVNLLLEAASPPQLSFRNPRRKRNFCPASRQFAFLPACDLEA